MPRDDITDILAFLAVARERSFTRAAAKMGVSQSALSHTVRALETRLGIRLLTRTTRSVSPTEAGERLLLTVAPRLEEVEAEIAAVREFGDRAVGTIRITAIDHVVADVLWPRLAPLLSAYPDIRLEMHADYRMVDIVADGYDIGVRYGDQVEKDMVAVRLSEDVSMGIVGAPAYLDHRPVPTTIADLTQHDCITLRLSNRGGLYAWELREGDRDVEARVSGQTTFNSAYPMLQAALDGRGLAFLPDELTAPHVAAGRLRRVMDDCCKPFPPLYAYYPSRRQSSKALQLVIETLRPKA